MEITFDKKYPDGLSDLTIELDIRDIKWGYQTSPNYPQKVVVEFDTDNETAMILKLQYQS